MSIPRFFIPPEAIDSQAGLVRYKDPDIARQISKVLRLVKGDKLSLLDGKGNIYHCFLEDYSKEMVIARISDRETSETQRTHITVAMAVLKGERFEWALEKLTELGVASIVPIIVSRSVVRPDKEISNKIKRWRTILKESAEQCERSTIPCLVPPLNFRDWLSSQCHPKAGQLKLICAERRNVPHFRNVLCNQGDNKSFSELIVVIGAEGGFTDEEVKMATEANFMPVSFGKRILRGETAAIYALTILSWHFVVA